MRKLSFLFSLTIFFISSLNAQKDSAFASARYLFTHIEDTTWPENPLKVNMILFLGKNMSNYTSFDRMENMRRGTGAPRTGNITSLGTLAAVSVPMQNMPQSGSSLPTDISVAIAVNGNYYKDMTSSKMSVMDFSSGKLFSVEEQIPVIDWNITQEIKEIMGLQCQKATGSFKGRVYDAWFCSQLPYSNGPWKLGGLPGLIIEAYDTKKEVVFSFVSFENVTGTQIPIAVPESASPTTAKEFKQYKEALAKDRQATAGSSSVSGGIRMFEGVPMGPDGKPAKMRQRNNPLEKEIKK